MKLALRIHLHEWTTTFLLTNDVKESDILYRSLKNFELSYCCTYYKNLNLESCSILCICVYQKFSLFVLSITFHHYHYRV